MFSQDFKVTDSQSQSHCFLLNNWGFSKFDEAQLCNPLYLRNVLPILETSNPFTRRQDGIGVTVLLEHIIPILYDKFQSPEFFITIVTLFFVQTQTNDMLFFSINQKEHGNATVTGKQQTKLQSYNLDRYLQDAVKNSRLHISPGLLQLQEA